VPSAEEDEVLQTDSSYTLMQRDYYETGADVMNVENHSIHNGNRDYWDILVGDTAVGFRDKVGLDFGCGCGRNVMNMWNRFARFDGVDISAGNLAHAERNCRKIGAPADATRFHHCNGVDLRNLPDYEYDFIMSTVVLQHICVHEIRLNYFREFFRIMRYDGLLSFQMGYGEGPQGKASYYENAYHAQETNSLYDVTVTDPQQVYGDLESVGFVDVGHVIRPAFDDGHPAWIYVKARKPRLQELAAS
jgi:ubiquinone/menaquinone biosynthesis C-methylase UbiE